MKKSIFVPALGQDVWFESRTLEKKSCNDHKIVGRILGLNKPVDSGQFATFLRNVANNLFPYCRYRTWHSNRLKGETVDLFFFDPRGWPTMLHSRQTSIFQLCVRRPTPDGDWFFCSVFDIGRSFETGKTLSWSECIKKRMNHYLKPASSHSGLRLLLPTPEHQVFASQNAEMKDDIRFFEHLYETYGFVWSDALGQYYWDANQLTLPTRELATV